METASRHIFRAGLWLLATTACVVHADPPRLRINGHRGQVQGEPTATMPVQLTPGYQHRSSGRGFWFPSSVVPTSPTTPTTTTPTDPTATTTTASAAAVAGVTAGAAAVVAASGASGTAGSPGRPGGSGSGGGGGGGGGGTGTGRPNNNGANGTGGIGGMGMPSSGGGGAQYQKNETTKELGKAAEKYQKQIEESTKSAQQAMKEQTSSFLSSLDKLKVPDVGGDFAKQISSFTDAIAKSDNKASRTAVDEIIAATKANADTQVAYVKALAQRLAPNGAGAPAASPAPVAATETIAERLQGFLGTRATNSAAASAVAASGRQLPSLDFSNGPSRAAAPSGARGAAPIYNLPEGVSLDP